MFWLAPVVVCAFLLVSRGGRRVGDALLGMAWTASAGAFVVAGITAWEMEPNFGPRSTVLGAVLALPGLVALAIGVLMQSRIGSVLSRADTARRASVLSWAALAVGLIVMVTASVQARGRPAAAPDLAPLVTIGNQPGITVAGDLRLIVEMRATSDATPGMFPEATCYLVADDTSGARHDVANLGKVERLSGSPFCPARSITLDPTRRVVYVEASGILSSAVRAWRVPGLEPTDDTRIWTCRRGRWLSVPRLWLAVAWLGLAVAALGVALGAFEQRRARRRFHSAREATHDGGGVLTFSDGRQTTLPGAADLPAGPVTVFGGLLERDSAYRAGGSSDGARVVPASLAELTAASTRRASFACALGVVVLGASTAPVIVALMGIATT